MGLSDATELEKTYNKLSDGKTAGIIIGIVVGLVAVGFIFLKIRRLLLAFIIGSSIASTIFSLSYLGIANLKNKGIDNYEYMAVYIPLIYGGFNVLNTGLSSYFSKAKYLPIVIPFVVGAIHGGVFTLLERYVMGNLPIVNFDFTKNTEWQVHIYAMLYYSAIYGVVVTFLNKLYFLY